MTVGGLILAAGEGRRFGATKQLAELRGRPLLEYAVESMLSVPAVFLECTGWMRAFRPHADRARAAGWPVHELATGHEAMVTAIS